MTHTNAVMGNWGSAVKTSARTSTDETLVDRGIFDSGCSGHYDKHLLVLKGLISKSYSNAEIHNKWVAEARSEVERIVVPSAVKIPEEKGASRTTSINSKTEETLTEPHKEIKDSSIDSLEDNPKIQAFNRE
ncbi:hypothetical protein Tco_0815614 [Tanacetum coccineum]